MARKLALLAAFIALMAIIGSAVAADTKTPSAKAPAPSSDDIGTNDVADAGRLGPSSDDAAADDSAAGPIGETDTDGDANGVDVPPAAPLPGSKSSNSTGNAFGLKVSFALAGAAAFAAGSLIL